MEWFWLFLSYGFLGYLLERMFAKVTAAPKQVRGCFLLLPQCPAYGIAMVVFLAVRDWTGASGWREGRGRQGARRALSQSSTSWYTKRLLFSFKISWRRPW